MMRNPQIATLVVLMSLFLFGCSSKPDENKLSKEQLIIGEWHFLRPLKDTTGYDENEVMVFFKNNVLWHGYKSGDSIAKKDILDYKFTHEAKFLEVNAPWDRVATKDSTEIIKLMADTMILGAKGDYENIVLIKTGNVPH